MISVNLIPASRRAVRARRLGRNRWIAVWTAYSIALAMACVATSLTTGSSSDEDPAVELKAVSARVQQSSLIVA